MYFLPRAARPAARLLVMAALILFAGGTVAVQAQVPNPPPVEQPTLRLASKVRGQAAISALGAHLSEVAARYGKTETELRRLLIQDQDLWVDPNGVLVYECAGLLPGPRPASDGGGGG